ncbi:MAG: PKD domain-containing protein [Verrucomicrobiales bacterium]|jgi:hypothetical protein|nr:PKD domain-containing protein [Verrucomicrobiales bacterium]
MRRRGQNALSIRVAAPCKGVITRLPENLADGEQRALRAARNVRCAYGVLANAPGYRALPTEPWLDSVPNLIFQANIKSELASVEERSPIIGTAGKVWAVSRTDTDNIVPPPPPPPPNVPPLVDAGPDRELKWLGESLTVTLAGSASDPDDGPEPLTVWWEQVSGPSTLTFSDTQSLTPAVTVNVAGEYVVKLTAYDGLSTVSDTARLLFYNNQPPVVNAGPDINDAPRAGLNMAGSAYDPDDGPEPLTVTWSLVSGPGTAHFTNVHNVQSGVTVSAPGEYVFRLTASDGADTASDEVKVSWKFKLGQFDSSVYDVLVLPNGEIVCCGSFTKYTKDNTVTQLPQHLCKLDSWGDVATEFVNNINNRLSIKRTSYSYESRGPIALKLQGNGQILALYAYVYNLDYWSGSTVPESFLYWDGKPLFTSILRLNQNGVVDTNFVVSYPQPFSEQGQMRAGLPNDIAVLPDNSILLMGQLQNNARGNEPVLWKFSPNGVIDENFAVGSGHYATDLLKKFNYLGSANGKFYFYSELDNFSGTAVKPGILRLNADGTRDTTWHTDVNMCYVTNNYFSGYTLLPDGTVFLKEYFSAVDAAGVTQHYNRYGYFDGSEIANKSEINWVVTLQTVSGDVKRLTTGFLWQGFLYTNDERTEAIIRFSGFNEDLNFRDKVRELIWLESSIGKSAYSKINMLPHQTGFLVWGLIYNPKEYLPLDGPNGHLVYLDANWNWVTP